MNGKWFYTVFRHSMWPHPSPALPFTHYVASMWVAIQKYCLLSFCKKWLFCEPSAYENFSNQNKILYFKRGTFGGLFLGLGLCEGSCALDAVPSLRHLPQAPLLPLKETGDPGPSCPLSLFPQIPNPKVCILEHQSGTAVAVLHALWVWWMSTAKSLVWVAWWSAKGFQIHGHIFSSFSHSASYCFCYILMSVENKVLKCF